MEHRALQHALESERRLHLGLLVLASNRGVDSSMNVLEFAPQPGEIGAAGLQHLDDRRGIEQCEQQVLDGDELVALFRARWKASFRQYSSSLDNI